jgi:hypothetical protein
MATLQQAAEELFSCPTNHKDENGIDAFDPIGLYGEGYFKCRICGKVICTDDAEEYPMFMVNVPAF